MKHYVVLGELSDLNRYIGALARNRFVGGAIKKEMTEKVAMQVRNAEPITKKSIFQFTWYVKNKRKDPDNVCGAGAKFCMDGLVMAGILPNDTMEWVEGFVHKFKIDKENPRVEIKVWHDFLDHVE